MLPLSLLTTAKGHPVLVELKNGETFNGHLFNCDSWMNIHLKKVICTSKDGDRFFSMEETYIRGNTIKYIRVPEEVLQLVKEGAANRREDRRNQPFRGRGRGGGPGGRGDQQHDGEGGGRGGRGGGRGGFRGGRGGRGGRGEGRGGGRGEGRGGAE